MGQPASSVVTGHTFNPAPRVRIADQSGNAVPFVKVLASPDTSSLSLSGGLALVPPLLLSLSFRVSLPSCFSLSLSLSLSLCANALVLPVVASTNADGVAEFDSLTVVGGASTSGIRFTVLLTLPSPISSFLHWLPLALSLLWLWL